MQVMFIPTALTYRYGQAVPGQQTGTPVRRPTGRHMTASNHPVRATFCSGAFVGVAALHIGKWKRKARGAHFAAPAAHRMKSRVLALFLSLVTFVFCDLYLLDCGAHAETSRNYILAEPGYNQTLISLPTRTATDCQDSPTPIEQFASVLDVVYIGHSGATPTVCAPFGAYEGNYIPEEVALLANKTLFYAAAGNDGTDYCWWPAIQYGVYAVAASDANGHPQPWSNRCWNKFDQLRVLFVSACSTSEATAIAAARGLTSNFTREVACPDLLREWQWPFMYSMVAAFCVFVGCCILGTLCLMRVSCQRKMRVLC